jgi:hypothetical protein
VGSQTAQAGALGSSRAQAGVTASRVVWGVVLLMASAVLVTAALLSPSPAGHGTHTQLGLPPCGFLLVTGVPCPGCGLTTSFSHMIRLQLAGAAAANPFGIALFMLTAGAVPLSVVGLVRNMPVIRTLDRMHFEKIAILLSATGVVVWCVRLGGLLWG